MLKKLQAMVCFTLSKKKELSFSGVFLHCHSFTFTRHSGKILDHNFREKDTDNVQNDKKNPAFLSLSSLQRVCCHCPSASVTRHSKDIAKSGLDTETIRKKTQNTFLSVGGSILVVTLQLSHHSQVFKEVGSFKAQTYKAQHSRCL